LASGSSTGWGRHVTMSRDEHGFTIRLVAGKI
jgi:hypothetical protein